jgi:hypothetical protein
MPIVLFLTPYSDGEVKRLIRQILAPFSPRARWRRDGERAWALAGTGFSSDGRRIDRLPQYARDIWLTREDRDTSPLALLAKAGVARTRWVVGCTRDRYYPDMLPYDDLHACRLALCDMLRYKLSADILE